MNSQDKKQLVLVVLDGWGEREESEANAIKTAHTHCFDKLWREYPHTTLAASGQAVGLPLGQMGNSEIGHMTLGTGHIFQTDLTTIHNACKTGVFFNNPVLIEFLELIQQQNGTLHLVGLLSDGGVHSHQNHLFALIRTAAEKKIGRIALHLYTDGRDTKKDASLESFQKLRTILKHTDIPVEIVSLCGRYFGMDRNNNDARTAQAEAVIVGTVSVNNNTPEEWIKKAHEEGVSDEHIPPARFIDIPLTADDGVLLWNFRPDRMRQITKRLLQRQTHCGFALTTMTSYDEKYPVPVLFPKDTAKSSLPQTLSEHGFSQIHIAESEKYPHVTYFFNGGIEKKHTQEEWVCIESDQSIDTYDKAPKMQAIRIAKEVCASIADGRNFILANIANPDMVGHTAHISAIKLAIEETDRALEMITKTARAHGATVIITADHGNAETNKHPDGTPHTAHTTNRVPCIITNESYTLRKDGSLADIAPTIYEIFEIKNPPQCDGLSLLE